MGESEPQSATGTASGRRDVEILEREALTTVRNIESAIRSSRIDTSPLLTRPELRRVQRILEAWRLLLPAFVLVITVSIPLLAHLGLWDGIDREISAGVATPPKSALLWPSLVYWIPALGLIVFAGSIISVQVYEFVKATRTSGDWVLYVPGAALVLTFISEVIILWLGTDAPRSALIVMCFTLGLVVLMGLLANWFVVTAMRHEGVAGFWPKCRSYMLCVVICVVVVGAGFGILFGLDVRREVVGEKNMPSATNGVDATAPKAGSVSENGQTQIGNLENSQNELSQDGPATEDAGPGDGSGLSENLTLGIFFVFIWVLVGFGIFWANKAIIWRHAVSEYRTAVSSAMLEASAEKKEFPKAFASDIGNRLGGALSSSRATDSAAYLEAACWALPGAMRQPGNQIVNIWAASALRSGIRFVYDAPAEHPVSYYMIYVHVVRGVATQLYRSFSSVSNRLPEALPGDVLIAARRMSGDIADLIYRADVQSIAAKHPPFDSTVVPSGTTTTIW